MNSAAARNDASRDVLSLISRSSDTTLLSGLQSTQPPATRKITPIVNFLVILYTPNLHLNTRRCIFLYIRRKGCQSREFHLRREEHFSLEPNPVYEHLDCSVIAFQYKMPYETEE